MSTFKHEDGRVLSAYPGSALEATLSLDVEWDQVDGQAAAANGGDGDVELAEMKRGQLDELAASLGIDNPAALPNKQAVVGAIEAARDDADEDAGGTLGD